MRRECWERFPHHRLQRKPLVRDPGMHHGTCVTHVSWCMLGSLNRGHDGGENVPGIPGACTTCNFTYLTRGLWLLPIANGKLYSISQFTWLLVHGFVLICDSIQISIMMLLPVTRTVIRSHKHLYLDRETYYQYWRHVGRPLCAAMCFTR